MAYVVSAPEEPITLATSFCGSVSGKKSETTGPLGEAAVLEDAAPCAALMAAIAIIRKAEDSILR